MPEIVESDDEYPKPNLWCENSDSDNEEPPKQAPGLDGESDSEEELKETWKCKICNDTEWCKIWNTCVTCMKGDVNKYPEPETVENPEINDERIDNPLMKRYFDCQKGPKGINIPPQPRYYWKSQRRMLNALTSEQMLNCEKIYARITVYYYKQ